MVMIVWFVLLSANVGYIEPMYVDQSACSAPSPTAGVIQVDREVNPRTVRWSNCLVDISARLASLPQGTYEIAMADRGVSGYIAPDPHVSATIVVGEDFEQTTARPTDRFTWTTADPLSAASAYRWELELDAVLQPTPLSTTCSAGTPNACSAPIPAVAAGTHSIRIRPVDISVASSPVAGPWSDSLTFVMRATPSKPGAPSIQPPGVLP